MKSLKKALLYGFLTWLVIFIVGFIAYVIHESNRPLFESIMAVSSTTVSIIFALLYFRNVEKDYIKEGWYLGLIFFLVNVFIDLPLFLFGGPMKTTFGSYMADIGLTYFLFFAVTIGLGYALEKKKKLSKSAN